MSGCLTSVPVLAVLAEDVGQRGAYRVGYQRCLALLPFADPVAAGAERDQEVLSVSALKRNKLLLVTGVLTAMFALAAKGCNCKKR